MEGRRGGVFLIQMCETQCVTHAHTQTHTHAMCMSGTHSSRRKLQHNDKGWEHNGLSSVQTEARTSLALKGQQTSPSFYSAPPVIIVQYYHHTLMAFISQMWEPSRNTNRAWKCEAEAREEAKGGGVCLFWKPNVLFPRAWPRLGSD